MNIQIKNIFAVILMIITLGACSSDDSGDKIIEGETGDVGLFFDNGVNGDALILGNSYTNSNGEKLTINRFNYIVSNIVLIKADGSEYVYPKQESYFVIAQEGSLFNVDLENVPAGDYTKIKFGIGVDQQQYLQGETAQQSFWDLASANNLTWTWSTGYRFVIFEGTFATTTNPEVSYNFQVHQGSNSATDNYREVTLDLPNTALVRAGMIPSIHLKTDLSVLLDGATKIKLSDNINGAGTAASIMGGENLIKIAGNSQAMFEVDHVHNGTGGDH